MSFIADEIATQPQDWLDAQATAADHAAVLPRPAAALGIDFVGHSGRAPAHTVQPVIGLYTEATSATQWRLSNSAKLGLKVSRPGRPELGVALIAHDGLSTQRQFFREESRYIGLELRVDL